MASPLALPAAVLATFAGACVLLSNPEPPASTLRVEARPEPVRYARDVRPILSDRCFACHGPDEQARKAGLRLDEAASATAHRKGGAAIVPGQPAASRMVKRIGSTDPDEMMPPPTSHKAALTDAQRRVIERWIEQGAAYESHWSFVAPKRPEPPRTADDSWARNDIDRFILASLERAGVRPSPEADRATLLRRVTLDLTGLPPTPDETTAFLADESPDAYERVVDRLLTQEPWRSRTAERLAAPWLDAARYADTCGIHQDNGRQMWLWRDWVLHAYRDNMPFDRFVIEQLAGDLIPDATTDQKIASGFNRNHITTDEGGAIAEEYLVEYAVDRASTTASVLLGLTMGCARCHDHKYDPITTKDFYGFYAFFNSIEEPGLYSQTQDPNRAYEPFITVPSEAQRERTEEIGKAVALLERQQRSVTREDEARRDAFFARIGPDTGVSWMETRVNRAVSEGGATLAPQPDGSVLAQGVNPDTDVHEFTLETSPTAGPPRLLLLEAIADASLGSGRLGRANNGNAVLTGIEVSWAPRSDPGDAHLVTPRWIWADLSQTNGEYHVTDALFDTAGASRGWAVDGHRTPGNRTLLLLADRPMGDGSPTLVTVRLKYRSMYARHVLGRVRFSLATCADARLLPVTFSPWRVAGPFAAKDRATVFDEAFGPESIKRLDPNQVFGDKRVPWRHDESFKDGAVVPTDAGLNVSYAARTVHTVAGATMDLSLGSDDGFRLFLDGREIAARNIERSAAPDQDKVRVEFPPGESTLVLKVVNTGGDGAFYHAARRVDEAMPDELVPAILPERSRGEEARPRLEAAWANSFSPAHRERRAQIDLLEGERKAIEAASPKTMVMKELETPRETFVLARGQYDHPDRARPVQRSVPAALGRLPDDAPRNRLGLARWLMSAENPLTARVAANRCWELVFGSGLVRTSEDFGLQGEWPTHPELLDWLAVDFREHGWNVRRMMRMMVTSSTYRQSSNVRTDLAETDPENRLLASYPRRRLTAEQVRDGALAMSGLLVERLGGPSVKPSQPEGLWQEVAMLSSNTREYKPGPDEENRRRSLYTYWKRASPPPSMLTFDAPTRESCTIRRASTNTPLQALVLWNDPLYVRAARELARLALDAGGDDEGRLVGLFRRCTGEKPDEGAISLLRDALADFRARFRARPDDARALIAAEEHPAPSDADAAERAAWTMVASSLLNLHQTVTQH
ncbi:MAG: PSD1 and planctomycete cytochrome C domain-containing protein [Phycisphaerae bacterium]